MTPDAGGLHVIPAPGGQVILKRGVTEMVVSGEGVEAVVEQVVGLVAEAGPEAAARAVALLPDGAGREAASRLLDALVARRLVPDDGEAPAPTAPDVLSAHFYANFGARGSAAPAALAQARVAVYGTGLVGRHLVAALEGLGVGSVVAADDPALRNPYAPEPPGSGEPPATPTGDGSADLWVATSDLGQESGLAAAGRRALAAGVRFLPAWVAELVGYVGPLTHPFETACLRCYQLRVDSQAKNLGARRALRDYVGEHPDAGAAPGLLPPMAAVVAQIAAVEIAMTLGGFAPSGATARSIEINLLSFRSTVRRVLKVPRCPDCGEGSRRAPRVIRRGPQIPE